MKVEAHYTRKHGLTLTTSCQCPQRDDVERGAGGESTLSFPDTPRYRFCSLVILLVLFIVLSGSAQCSVLPDGDGPSPPPLLRSISGSCVPGNEVDGESMPP